MTHDKRQFIRVLYRCDQRNVERKDRAARFINGLKCVWRLARAIIDNDIEITIHICRARAALGLCNGFNGLNHFDKSARGLFGPQRRRWR